MADHRAVSCSIPLRANSQSKPYQHESNTFCSMKTLNANALNPDLSDIPWTNLLSSATDVNDMVAKFNDNFISTWNKHALLLSRRTRKNRMPWMNDSVLALIHRRDKAFKSFLLHKDDASSREYKSSRNAVTNTIQLAKREFFICDARMGSKQFWRHINNCTGLGRIKQLYLPLPSHNVTAAKMLANRINYTVSSTVWPCSPAQSRFR